MLSFDRKLKTNIDWSLLICTLLILLLGFLNLHSATFNLPEAKYLKSQLLWMCMGFVLMLPVVLVDYRILERLAYPIYCLVLILLLVVMFIGKKALGAQRWLQVGPFSIQPSELAKIAITLCLARYFHYYRGKTPMGIADLWKPLMLALIPFVLILPQPDLGTALVVLCVSSSTILFMGIQRKILIILLIVFLATAPLTWKFALRPYQRDRIFSFLNPEKFALSKGYQLIQSKIAIGSGELTGKGYLKGTQSKLQFLPKQHTDFVFSNFAEEFGFVGSVFLILLYASLALLGLNIALRAKEIFGMILAFGLTMLLASQIVINLAMEMGALPVVGITLPLFSYGGTSLITSLLGIALLMNISMRRYMF